MNLFKFAYAASLPLVLGALCLMGCDGGSDYNRAGVHSKIEDEATPEDYALVGKSFRVRNMAPNAWFSPDSRAVAYVFDSSLYVIDSVEGSPVDASRSEFEFPAYDYKSPYVAVSLSYATRIMWPTTANRIYFSVITDISEVENPRIDLMTDIEVPMIWEFVSEGYSFSEAKKKAMQDVAKAFHFTEQDTLPAELYARPFEEVAGLYAYLLRGLSESSFAKNKSYLKEDLSDGTIDDTDKNIEFAEFIVNRWLSVDSLLDKLDSTAGVNKWKFFERMVDEAFGLPDCKDRLGKVDSVANSRSSYYRDSLVCDAVLNKNDSLVYFRRFLTDLEKQFGPCIVGSTPRLEKVSEKLSYKCTGNYASYGLSADGYRMEFKNGWEVADDEFIRNYHFGACHSENLGQKSLFHDSIFVCEHVVSDDTYSWNYESQDTVGFYLGECDTGSVWTLGRMPDSSEYVCTHDSLSMRWSPANDINKFLAEQRKCNRETDALRSFSYSDLFYYRCDDVKIGDMPAIYSFKGVSSGVADSLAFIATLEPCDPVNAYQYAYDSTGNHFYHCETRNDNYQYYEVDEKVGRQAMCGEFVKTLPACTAESDTLEVVDCPYNVTRYESTVNVFYHCSNVDGKYAYGQVDYWDLKRYESLREARESGFCNDAGEEIHYTRDAYGYLYYCVETGGEYHLEPIEEKALADMLADQYMAGLEPCDATVARWRSDKNNFLSNKYYFVCDYDTNANFMMMRVDEAYYGQYTARKNVGEKGVKIDACSEDVLAARGAPVEAHDGNITDPRDSRSYRVVTIGKQTWMAENLNYYDPVANPNMTDPQGCASDAEQCEATGRLYYWYAAVGVPNYFDQEIVKENLCLPVQGICPAGWHIPTVEEWSQLFQYVSYYNDGAGYGGGLKGKDGWSYRINWSGDLFGFSASPVTWTTDERAYFAAADVITNLTNRQPLGIRFTYGGDNPTIFTDEVSRSYSVRCVKD